jgi:hypothetical protein
MLRLPLILLFAGFTVLAGLRLGNAPAAEVPGAVVEFERTVAPFFKDHCTRCHGEKKQKGDLRLDTLTRDFAAPPVAMHWAMLNERLAECCTSGILTPRRCPPV